MARKRYKPEEIVGLLRRAEVLYGQGLSMADAIQQLGISEVTFYRWRKEYGGMGGDQLRRIKEDTTRLQATAIYAKVGVSGRAALVAEIIQALLLLLPDAKRASRYAAN